MALFYRRHPEVARRKSQMLNPARAQKLNRPIVTEYFGKLRQILMDLNIMNQPQRIYNIDEKGCRLTLHHQQQVLSRKGAKRVHLIAPEHSESATVVISNLPISTCGNALGQCIPDMVLFKGKRQKPEWIDSMPPGTSIAMTARGSMTAVTYS
ncbi:mediator of rna polymerase ii transcription subunit 1 [Holotrichia oblita]|uniref:Mediator of rna polymerase ii transcription subunit 1 n=2 Tax=Holotrichia oblita TaxID=644536 RepID=A0ACB9SQG1_HOLOL|nr:mediator of rna polymerase ii transcription subunit 1 [Holotrichia oblita]KAI4456906.1 mediator of rna polymerase ii transcription subunit 1 [Holotrichia oblita]